MTKAVVLIPARYQSSRFPGKPLADIDGQSMIERVYHKASESGLKVCVVTDDDRIESHLIEKKLNVVRVDDDVPSGTERIALAFDRFFANEGYEYIVNFQGDEPLFPGAELKRILNFHLNTKFDIATFVRQRNQSEQDFKNPNVVKAILGANEQCFYFTRASAPFNRTQEDALWWQHLGVYCYSAESLKKFVACKLSRLENWEKLEQLRALENGLTLGALETTHTSLGVDTPEDLAKVIGVLRDGQS